MSGYAYHILSRWLPKALIPECLRAVARPEFWDLNLQSDPLDYILLWNGAAEGVWFFETSCVEMLGWVRNSSPSKSGYRYCPDSKQRAQLLELYRNYANLDATCASGSTWGLYHYLQAHPTALNPRRHLLAIASSGNLRLLNYVIRDYNLKPASLSFDHHNLLHQAVAFGAVSIVRFLNQELKLEVEDFRASEDHSHLFYNDRGRYEVTKTDNWSIIQAIIGGHLEMIQYLHQVIGLYPEDFRESGQYSVEELLGNLAISSESMVAMIRYLYQELNFEVLSGMAIDKANLVLDLACRSDNVAIVRLLYTELGLTHEVLKEYNIVAQALEHRSPGILEYLAQIDFDIAGALALDPLILGSLPEYIFGDNDLEMLQCLHRTLGFDAKGLRNYGRLELNLEPELLDFLKYLHREMKLTAADFQAIFDEELSNVVAEGEVCWLQYLHQVVGIDLNVFRGEDDTAVQKAISNGNLEIIQYLHRYKPFPALSSEDLAKLSTEDNREVIQFFRSLT